MQSESANRSDIFWPDSRTIALAIGLGFAVFLAAGFCMSLPRGSNGVYIFWFTNGIPLAALLRSRLSAWPTLIIAAIVGIVAATMLVEGDPLANILARSLSNALQYSLCALILRRRLGDYFDLTRADHLRWLGGAAALTSALHIIFLAPLIYIFTLPYHYDALSVASWFTTYFLGLFVFALPLLALTAQSSLPETRLDGSGIALLVLLATVVSLVFGPPAFVGAYIILPVLMFLAWRHGLQGAGLGAIITVLLISAFTYLETGIPQSLKAAGYSASQRGHFLELFLGVAMLMSLPLAISRMRQIILTNALGSALEAAEARTAQLVESEASAVQAKERLRRIIETSNDVICTLDTGGRFLEISENCQTIMGWPREQLIGRYCFDFLHTEDRDQTILNYGRRRDGSLSAIAHKRYIRPDGSTVPMSWSYAWFEDEQVCHCVGRDMTEFQELEAHVYEAQRMEAIGKLTGGMAHDFNNLLTVMIGNCEALASELVSAEHRRLANMSLRAARQAAELTGQLLAFARRQPLSPHAFDANELLAASAPMIARTLGEHLEISIQQSEDLWPVFADPLQTETAILNLCLNARDAMPQGGRLQVITANATLTEDDVQAHPQAVPGDYVLISVSDTGTGISEDHLERIFEPFFTTKEAGHGSGLGLSMVYGFVKQSHGHLNLTSEIGKGTTVTLYLPAADKDGSAREPAKTATEAIDCGNERVLIVEDHELVQDHVRNLFQSLGYRVTVASNGAEALAILEQHDDIDLLFTDIVMPGGISGQELGERVAESWPQVRILYTSGSGEDAFNKDGNDAGNVALLRKPYVMEELSRVVRKILDSDR